MKIAFRVDASIEIGTGHVMRCLTFARELAKKTSDITFFTGNLPGNLNQMIAKEFKNVVLESTPWDVGGEILINELAKYRHRFDLLIIDHYFLQENFERQMYQFAKKIFVIEDMPNRRHSCDYVLIQNELDQKARRYEKLIPDDCVKFLGPKFALLAPEYLEQRKHVKQRSKIKNILVFYSGIDKTNETCKAIEALKEQKELKVDVVIGENNPHRQEVQKAVEGKSNFKLHVQTTKMAELIGQADLCLGAGGFACFERFALGLPTLAISIAENQTEILEILNKEGLLKYLGLSSDLTAKDLKNAVLECVENPTNMFKMADKALKLVDGEGAKRVVEVLIGVTH